MADQQTDQTKERKSLGVVFPNTNKENPKSYDLKGTVTVEGKKQSGSQPGVEEPAAFSTVAFMLCSANASGAA